MSTRESPSLSPENDRMDSITLLKSKGPKLTKTWTAKGEIEAYDDARFFRVNERPVANIQALYSLLKKASQDSQVCAIRGTYLGNQAAKAAGLEMQHDGDVTWIERRNIGFEDLPKYQLPMDVDGYEPILYDPVTQPELAVEEFIRFNLPPEFRGASYIWQLSSSAGAPGKDHLLKVHLWFWSATPYTGAQLTAWARSKDLPIDVTIWRRVQVNYTAGPVFEPGVVDPVPVRMGFVEGWESDEVDLVIDPDLLSWLENVKKVGGSDDQDRPDPCEKPGWVGAFCRAYPTLDDVQAAPELDFYEYVRQFNHNDRRLNWLHGGGTPGGAWMTGDGKWVSNGHNTAPGGERLLCMYDLVRVHKFGHLDRDLPEDEKWIADSPKTRPSEDAMKAFCRGIPKVKEELDKLLGGSSGDGSPGQDEPETPAPAPVACDIEALKTRISTAGREELLDGVLLDIARAEPSQLDEEVLLKLIQRQLRGFDGVNTGIPALRRQLAGAVDRLARAARPPAVSGAGVGEVELADPDETVPEWLMPWCYSASDEAYVHVITKQQLSTTAFDNQFTQHIPPSENGSRKKASVVARERWPVRPVDGMRYWPGQPRFFGMDGVEYLNSYRPELAPKAKPKAIWTDQDRKIVQYLDTHLELLVPNSQHRKYLKQWMAFVALNPGQKVIYAPLLAGIEGDGKTILANIMTAVLHHSNVKIVSADTLTGSGFTGWVQRACLLILEELKLNGHNRHDVNNKLKPIITNKSIEVHAKGKDPYNILNMANVMGMTNHYDALPLNNGDRRWMILFSPWRKIDEMWAAITNRLGVEPEEFWDVVWDAEKHPALMRAWLEEVDLSDFNEHGRAPDTEFKATMIANDMTDAELTIKDLVEDGDVGICRDVVLGNYLSEAVARDTGEKPQSRRLSKMLQDMGLRPHKVGVIKWQGKTRRVYVSKDWADKSIPELRERLNQTLEET